MRWRGTRLLGSDERVRYAYVCDSRAIVAFVNAFVPLHRKIVTLALLIPDNLHGDIGIRQA